MLSAQFLLTGELLGFDDFIPSFLAVDSSEILKGVNYASGSAGIRQETGKQLGVNLELSKQLENHHTIVSRIVDMTLYNSGARKVALNGIGPIGCAPYSTANYDTKGSLCVDSMNDAVNYFNRRLKSLVNQLNNDLADAKFIYLNAVGFGSEYTASPGFSFKLNGCCKANEHGQCVPNQTPCIFRSLSLFWDLFHPTEVSNKLSALLSYRSLKKIL
ncbi:hypothetical protein OIU77_000677 [Salix suchowensis]|uniref:GDSL esterase/lipase n=1 Tax=Salix suchowensis TaxID=1278906 RepID=A0ABQ9B707_9ROSI|nr:hypothetical protein OIU77_000677 [Salix suchowensis]